MKILAHYYTHKPGGLCHRLYRLLNTLATTGDEVHYFTLDLPPKDLVNTSVHTHIIPFWTTKRSGLLFWISFILFIPIYLTIKQREIKSERIVAFGAIYAALLAIPKYFTDAKLILFIRSLVFKNNRINNKSSIALTLSDYLERIGALLADHVVFMSETMKRDFQDFFKLKVKSSEILPNDIPKATQASLSLKDLLNIPAETKLILSAGVIDKRKDLGTLMQAFNSVTKERGDHNLHLVIIGDGPERSSIKNQFAIGNAVHMPGWIDNLPLYLGDDSLYVHPSLHEGMSNVVLEALAAKLPILAADTPENREMFGENAPNLFTAGNSDALKVLIERIESDPNFRNEIVKLTEQIREKLAFDWDKRAREIILKVALLR